MSLPFFKELTEFLLLERDFLLLARIIVPELLKDCPDVFISPGTGASVGTDQEGQTKEYHEAELLHDELAWGEK